MNSIAASRFFPDKGPFIPRFRDAGDVTLDLYHSDARVDDHWLALHPREFDLLWHLAETPGKRVTKQQLLADVWRVAVEPETDGVADHLSRIREKLAAFGLESMLVCDPAGSYALKAPDNSGDFTREIES